MNTPSFLLDMHMGTHQIMSCIGESYTTSKTPYVAIDERGLVRSIHLFLFSCVH